MGRGASELVACLGVWASEWASEVVGGLSSLGLREKQALYAYLRCFSDLFPRKFAKGQPDSRISRFKEREGQFDTVV